MDIIKPINYETIPVEVEAFVVPDFNEFIDDSVKCKQFLDEVNNFVNTTHIYIVEIVTFSFTDKKALRIYNGLDALFAFPGNIIVKGEDGNIKCYETINFSKTFREVNP